MKDTQIVRCKVDGKPMLLSLHNSLAGVIVYHLWAPTTPNSDIVEAIENNIIWNNIGSYGHITFGEAWE